MPAYESFFVGDSGAAIRLAGEGALKDVFAGKPGSYKTFTAAELTPRWRQISRSRSSQAQCLVRE
jgi:hypothetical protein